MRIGRVIAMAVAAMLPFPLTAQNIPGVDVQMSTPPSELAQGVSVQARVMADPKAYIVVFRVTTDNRIVVISPRTPDGVSQVQSGGRHPGERDVTFQTDPFDGVGHVFAAASYTPFDFSKVRVGANWDIQTLDDPPDGNPQDVANWFLEQVIPSSRTPYSVNAAPYYVGVAPSDSDSMDNTAQTADQGGGGGPPQYPAYAPDTLPDTTYNPAMADSPVYDYNGYYPGGFYPTFYFSAGWGGAPYAWYGPRIIGPRPLYVHGGGGYYGGYYGGVPRGIGHYPGRVGRVGGRSPGTARYAPAMRSRVQRSAPSARAFRGRTR